VSRIGPSGEYEPSQSDIARMKALIRKENEAAGDKRPAAIEINGLLLDNTEDDDDLP
jgi:hypothetical protein